MNKQIVLSALVASALLGGQPLFAKDGGGEKRQKQERKQEHKQARKQEQNQERKQEQKQERKQEQKQERKQECKQECKQEQAQERKQAIIKAFDSDGDGKLSDDELNTLRQLLDTMKQ